MRKIQVFLRASSSPPIEHDGNELGDEREVIARAQLEPRAFGPLYTRYVGLIYGYCYRRLGSREAAEDATSLVFQRAVEALPSFRGGIFRAWLLIIAQHTITDTLRRTHPSESLDSAKAMVDPALAPEEIALLADEQRLLQTALALLSHDERWVIELRLSGLRSTEVAVILGRSPESVRQLQLRATKRLQALLRVSESTKGARHA
jgi:RNA polymerase sigma-70 factor (ECF subfamily)